MVSVPAPDYAEPILGVREWHISQYGPHLRSLASGFAVWNPGVEMKAECECEYDHKAPAEKCGCGLHSFYDLDCETSFGDYGNCPYKIINIGKVNGEIVSPFRQYGVRGVVSMWGKIILHDYGFRAERMKIEALIQPLRPIFIPERSCSLHDLVAAVACHYGVPLIDTQGVEEFMKRWEGVTLKPDPIDDEPRSEEIDVKISGFEIEKIWRGWVVAFIAFCLVMLVISGWNDGYLYLLLAALNAVVLVGNLLVGRRNV